LAIYKKSLDRCEKESIVMVKGGGEMSDRFDEAAAEYKPKNQWVGGLRWRLIKELAHFARWYHEKYLAEALTAAAMMKVHEKGTCEWKEGVPDKAGYYLAAWYGGVRLLNADLSNLETEPSIIVTELWFNESTGWFSARGYLHEKDALPKDVKIVAWMPMPKYCGRRIVESKEARGEK
jgi:hypothetical protein